MAAQADRPAGRPMGGLARVLLAAAAMGTLGPVAALAYAEGMGPATFSALRAAIGAAILGAMVLVYLFIVELTKRGFYRWSAAKRPRRRSAARA